MEKKLITRKEFEAICKDIIDRKNIDDVVLYHNLGWGIKQYLNCVYWYRVIFKEDHYINYNGKKIIGFHIMPYQITDKDIMKAEIEYNSEDIKFNGEKKLPFNKEIVINPNYVDYDPSTSNFHKKIDDNYQIVLVDISTKGHYGPGLPTSNIKYSEENRKSFLDSVKKDKVYYPNVDQKIKNNNTNSEQIENLVDDILKILNVKN